VLTRGRGKENRSAEAVFSSISSGLQKFCEKI